MSMPGSKPFIRVPAFASNRPAPTVRFALLVLMLAAVDANAQMYKWKDASGRTQYGDRPPPGVEASPMRSRAHKPDEAAAKRLRSLVESTRSTQTEELSEDDGLEMQAPDEAEQCLVKRKEFDMLLEQLPVYRDADGNMRVHQSIDTYKGERTYISDADRPAEIEAARSAIWHLCRRPADVQAQRDARTQQVRAEKCAAYRADLALVLEPRVKAPDDKIEAVREKVAEFCD